MFQSPRISSLLFVNYRARRTHRAPRYGATKTTNSVEKQSVLPNNPPTVEPPERKPKKSLVTTLELKRDKRSLAITYDHLGFHWDPFNGVVSLTEEERSKCLQAVKDGLASICLPAKSQVHLRGIVAALQHACHVVISGRSHVLSLIEGVLHKGRREKSLLPDDLRRRVKQDLEWWGYLLEKKGYVTELSDLKKGKVMDEIYTDASPGGIGIVINGKPSNRRWKEGVNPDTHWAETIAVEVVVRYLVTNHGKGSQFTVNCDNTTVVDSWTMGRCNTHAQVDEAFLSILRMLVQHECWLSLEWIPSNMNQADEASRSTMNLEHPLIA